MPDQRAEGMVRIEVWVTKEERAAVKGAAASEGESVGAYTRRLWLEDRSPAKTAALEQYVKETK